MSKFLKIKESERKVVTSTLVGKYGLPKINSNLSIYYRSAAITLEVTFLNGICYVRFYNSDIKVEDALLNYFESSPPIYVENKNIRYLFTALNSLGIKQALISRIIKLDFIAPQDKIISFQLDTLVGDLLNIEDESQVQEFSNYYEEILISRDLDERIDSLAIERQDIFDKLGNINQLIKEHAEIYGINLGFNDLTIETAQFFKSNDYSDLDQYFQYCVDNSLFSAEPSKFNPSFIEPISIVIPCYNSKESILKTLKSIESQTICRNGYGHLVEVILVDDGSKERVADYIDTSIFKFKLEIVRLEKNTGLSAARNTGAAVATNDNLLFIDSDILLSKNYIYEHLLRLKTVPGAIFMSLKHNIDKENDLTNLEMIIQGLEVPLEYNDKRLLKKHEKDAIWINAIATSGIFEVLGETKYFANFGNGRKINGYDLPSAVVGHNLSMTKSVFDEVGGFSKEFTGWGLEDTLFGATAIAKGYFVIPVLASGVYHINHPVRSISEDEKLREYKKNIEIYKELIKKSA